VQWGCYANLIWSCMILRVTSHRVLALSLIGIGVSVIVFARQISTLKSSAWARFYQRHPRAAEKNPLSVHAGTERSIRLGAFMWRIVGAAIAFNGLIRLQ
jgi:hypothetical protein